MSDESISVWIEQLKQGDPRAAEIVWQHFFAQLLRLARHKLGGTPRRVADEEDVVLSVFDSVFRRVQAGHFPQLKDRNGLWQLLLTVTERKAINQARNLHRLKRGGGKVLGDSALLCRGEHSLQNGFDQLPSAEPTAELAAIMTETVEQLLGQLDDDMRQLALLKLEGYTNEEIATRIRRSVPTIERRLRLVRAKWQEEGGA